MPRYIPICCRFVAIHKTIPQRTPPVRRVLFAVLVSGFFVRPTLSVIDMIRTRKSAPIKDLMQLNEYGPMASPPSLCATNEIPHIKDVSTSISEFRLCNVVFVFIVYFTIAPFFFSITFITNTVITINTSVIGKATAIAIALSYL